MSAATLRVFVQGANSRAGQTLSLVPVTDAQWTERDINWKNQPELHGGVDLAAVSLRDEQTGTWLDIDVTQLVQSRYGADESNKELDLALKVSEARSKVSDIRLASRESGRGPELEIRP